MIDFMAALFAAALDPLTMALPIVFALSAPSRLNALSGGAVVGALLMLIYGSLAWKQQISASLPDYIAIIAAATLISWATYEAKRLFIKAPAEE